MPPRTRLVALVLGLLVPPAGAQVPDVSQSTHDACISSIGGIAAGTLLWLRRRDGRRSVENWLVLFGRQP